MTAQDKALKENTASAPLQIVAPGTCVETGEQAALVLGMYDHLVETIHQYNPSADFAQIDKAFRYADTHHNGQLRKDGSPFITHPLAVAQIIAEELRLDSESIEAALMHDCIEDTSATYAEIAKEFSPAVADLVEGVSKLTRVQYASKEEEQMENLRKMLMAMAKDIRVILIKLADRTHNMRTMEYQTAEKQRQKSLETMEIYAPIAHRLGMQRIKWELEDLSLKYLDPVGYDEITRSLEAKQSEHEAFMERVQAQIEARLKEQHVPYLKVYGRMKHPYSIYRKMFVDDIDVENLPEGWRMGTIGEFCKETKSGGTPNRSNPKYWDKHHYRWLKSGEVANNIIFDTEEYISREGLKGSSAKIIPSGTVVMAMYGATASQVTYLDCDTTTNQACCNMLTATFEEAAYLYFHCLYQQENIKRLANGGAQENLSQELICAQPILICENTHIYDVFSKLLSAKIAFSKENYCCGILLKNLLSNIVII